MAWIESHQELRHHPKTRRVARALNVSVPAVVGHLHCFWWWAMDYAQDGNLSRYDDGDIADAAGWEGDASQFVDALRDARFIDDTEIHDWNQYVGKLMGQRLKNAEKKRAARQGDGAGRPADGTGTGRGREGGGNGRDQATQHNTTQPDRTKPNLTEPAADAASAAAAETEIKQCFDAWFNATGSTVTAQIGEGIADWCERVGVEVVLEAIRETGRSSARSWKYTHRILERWQADGRDSPVVDSFEEQKRRYAEGARLFAVHPP